MNHDPARTWSGSGVPGFALLPDGFIAAAPYVVGALLVGVVWRQFVPVERIGRALDGVAILPQWRFYAQRQIGSDEGIFDDLHLIARIRTPDGKTGPWQALLGPGERSFSAAVWHPQRRSDDQLTELMQALCPTSRKDEALPGMGSIPYLATLRFCLDAMEPAAGQVLQFAIVTTRGRRARTVDVTFLSHWHSR